MSEFYQEMAGMAKELLREFGRSMTLRKPGEASGPDWDPTPGEPIDMPFIGVQSKYNAMEIDGQLIQQQDRKVFVEALDEPPTQDMTLIDRGRELQIVSVQTVEPGDGPVLYILQVRA
ncbi:hypothetical protein [Pseudomonas luteola]|uniref:Phage protein n=1 Tax=Pseudomonas luteola TaxID=47886 RepID=A0ABS0MUY2_PSELU|nr:hypothetical protein [Pseudomonas luteola]MBH3440535.1 hypothetical protein [Pseudomonas luteola]